MSRSEGTRGEALAAEYLREYSENCQVIMFTCHGAVRDAAVKAGAVQTDLGEKNER